MSIAIRKTPFGFRLPSGRLAWIATAVLLLLGTATAAYGFWASTTSSNNATAAADALSPGSKPAVTANGASVSVSWAAGTTVNEHAATGYTVTRYATAAGGTGTPATGACAGTVTTLTCIEQNVPGGTWYYTVTPTIALWTGAESPRSTGISSDSTAPVASVSSLSPTPNAAGWNNNSPVTVTITADDGPAGSGVASITYAVDGGAKRTVNGAIATIPVTGDWTHTISYFATDNAGNIGSVQTQPVWIDTQAPDVPSLTVPAYVNSGNVAAVPVTGTAEAGARITLVASDPGAAHSVSSTATASATGDWSASPDLGSLNQGTVTYTATATDSAGNTGGARNATSIKDTVPPAAAQALSVPAYVNISNASVLPVSGTAEAGITVTVTATDAGAAHTVTEAATASGTGSWSLNLNLSGLNDGPVTYSITAKDAAGNTGTAYTTSSTKDTVAPAPTIAAPMYVNGSSNISAVQVSGTTEAGTIVNVTVRNGLSSFVSKAVTTTGTTWNTTMDLSTIPDGTLIYTADSTDAAGNSGTATAKGITNKDTKLPSISAVSLLGGGTTAGTADAGDTLTIRYSEALDASKICSIWNNTGAQILKANNDVTVTFNHSTSGSTTSNTMTVTSKTCTLNIGTISLGSNANYASTATPVVFVGTNTGVSTVTWNPDTFSLTIQLGATKNNTGAQGTNVGADFPAYAPASGLTDVAGNPLATAPAFTSTSSSRF
ncbi:OmpL47-type beta-barrel domain-containing protein [Arthrobacter sp. SLBN-122]|uniref:OmpL47-type beta-barrel domain-containing protein n=1 Tax=Arthrobacter sp. SLBN-122 TaxID=2768455 RepID=UPI001153C81C|nr:Ig-like domain-containing protein [Arthrobacter sp. SLBN-122]TQJ33548.1 hypothetical protein FBY36_0762 [Arthrobacter sp. SLBN-122]